MVIPSHTALGGLDLNLLVTLEVLLTERHVTRAARRLGVSQPAVSVQLAKLRDALRDPLLLPGPRGMTPTALALSLEAPLREALRALGEVLMPARVFEPAQAENIWRVAASDYAGRAIVQPLLPDLRRDAPGTRLAVLAASPRHLARQAEQGEIDLGFVTADASPATLRRRSLFQERYVLIGREAHPALRRRPTVARFCRLEFAVVSPDGGGFVTPLDAILEARQLKRRVVLSVPHFLLLLSAVAHSDLVALVPARLVAGAPALRVVEPPLEVPGFEMTMVWPERVHRDPAHQWLRERIVAATATGPRRARP